MPCCHRGEFKPVLASQVHFPFSHRHLSVFRSGELLLEQKRCPIFYGAVLLKNPHRGGQQQPACDSAGSRIRTASKLSRQPTVIGTLYGTYGGADTESGPRLTSTPSICSGAGSEPVHKCRWVFGTQCCRQKSERQQRDRTKKAHGR